MTSIVFYFQVHQPFRVKAYPHDAIGKRHDYFDDWLNEDVAKRVAELCYLPMNETLLDAIERTGGQFRCSFSISGTAIRQFERWAPEVLESFRKLQATGAVEFLCETSRHSLAALADPLEFRLQVEEQKALLKRHFGVVPTSFRNTELITDETVAAQVKELGFEVLLAEGADQLLEGRTSNVVYGMEAAGGFPVMLRSASATSSGSSIRSTRRPSLSGSRPCPRASSSSVFTWTTRPLASTSRGRPESSSSWPRSPIKCSRRSVLWTSPPRPMW
ncbi:MAG: alpha-amylase [Planctomycetota bacterium]|jgi:alpha-amylase